MIEFNDKSEISLNRACLLDGKQLVRFIGPCSDGKSCMVDTTPSDKHSDFHTISIDRLEWATMKNNKTVEVTVEDDIDAGKPFILYLKKFFDKDVSYLADKWRFLYVHEPKEFVPFFIRVEDKFGVTRFVKSNSVRFIGFGEKQ